MDIKKVAEIQVLTWNHQPTSVHVDRLGFKSVCPVPGEMLIIA